MEFRPMSAEEIKNLSIEEKKEFVRTLLDKSSHVSAAFIDPETGKSYDFSALVEAKGEEEAIDIIIKALESTNTKTIALTGEEVNELIAKAKKGELTEEEEMMLKMVMSSSNLRESDFMQYQESFMTMLLELTNYAQKERGYHPSLYDVVMPISVLATVNGLISESSSLHKYAHMSPQGLTSMTSQLGKDIYDTWKASCTSEVDKELVILGLFHLIEALSIECSIKIHDAKEIAESLSISLDADCEDECECCGDCSCGSEKNNGSNIIQPSVFNASSQEDTEMRDFLKE